MSGRLETHLAESRRYPPPAAMAERSNVGPDEAARAAADPLAFWAEQAGRLAWDEPWHTVLDWRPATRGADGGLSVPAARWFDGGRLNAAVNCLDRHVDAGHGARVALHVEPESGDPAERRTLTYADLLAEVSRAANALTALGVGPGDRVVLYLPVVPETLVATLAVARVGAVHSLVFGGFSAAALRFRVQDTGAKVVIASDGQFRRGRAVAVKATVDEALEGLPAVEHVLVVRRTGAATPGVPWTPGRDVWWHDAVGAASPVHAAASFDAEHPLFITYTSGSTGRPKGLLHTTGGYLTHAGYAHWAHFDVKPGDVHWCTADLAWVTAHTFAVYGPLLNGVTQVMYEGTPDTPHRGRHFEVIERYGVTTYYTAPTLVRSFMAWGDHLPAHHDLSSIRLLGSVGEPINPEAWSWFRDHVGGGTAPVVDTWWQSETGATVIAPLPGLTTLKPGCATRALPGLDPAVVDDDGVVVAPGEGGHLVIRSPWPGMARTVWGDPERYRDAYWRRFADRGWYVSGDGARCDEDGDTWVLGRLDDVVNVSGHRLSTSEVESALVAHPAVAEAGVVGVADARTGQAVVAFVVPVQGAGEDAAGAGGGDTGGAGGAGGTDLPEALRAHVAQVIGAIARPREVLLVADLPKTRSGKIVRRLLGDLLEGREPGDTTSLQDERALEAVRTAVAARAGARETGPR